MTCLVCCTRRWILRQDAPSYPDSLKDGGSRRTKRRFMLRPCFCRNAEGSADWVRTNAFHVGGSWVWGEQQGNVGSWLSTMKETWKFNIDLTYEHKIEKYDSSISTGPFFQSSYSRPTGSVQSGIWAPPDWIRDQLDLFVMSSESFARQMKLEWIDNSNCDFRACAIDGQRFGRE